jgi:HD-GYP domain-containing protein (c-di-GMP phosphodiesterase class II)
MASNAENLTIPVTELRIGMVLPSDVFDARNSTVLLLSRGIPVTQQLLDRLKSRGVQQLSVDPAAAAVIRGEAAPRRGATRKAAPAPTQRQAEPVARPKGAAPPTRAMPSAETKRTMTAAKREAAGKLKLIFASAHRNKAANCTLAKQLVADSVSHIMSDIDAYLKVALSTSESSEVYEHCLAVAQLAMSVGCCEGMDRQAVTDLGTGCILSRLGQSETAKQTTEKMQTLDQTAMLDVKKTPARTFDLLQDMRDISVGARGVAYQIFERFDGSGYPRARAGNQIAPLARIASACDVYVALTSPRPHREAFEPYVAIEMLIKETREGKFDPLAIRSLLRTVGLFPIGSYVRLSDGSVGQVIRNHRDHYDRPVVHLFFDADVNEIQAENRTLDLHEAPEILVESAVPASLVQDMLMPMSSGDGDFFAGDGMGEGGPEDWLGGFVAPEGDLSPAEFR